MLNRRDFIKISLASGALVSLGNGAKARQTINPIIPDSNFCLEKQKDIPVIEEMDVVIVGGTIAAVEAAVAVSKQRKSAMLITSFPYLGEDACGTLNLYKGYNDTKANDSGNSAYVGIAGSLQTNLSVKLFGKDVNPPTPLHVKSTLENELINNNIKFLYSSFVTNTLKSGNDICGVVISNRSGRQAIKAKAVIDATQTAGVASMAGAKFKESKGNRDYKFITAGNTPKENPKIKKSEILAFPINWNGKKYPVTEYTFSEDINPYDYGQLMKLENEIRSILWDPNQVDSSDIISFVPDEIITKDNNSKIGISDISLINSDVFKVDNLNNIWVLGPSLHLMKKDNMEIGKTEMFVAGQVLGYNVANNISENLADNISVSVNNKEGLNYGDVNEILKPLRNNLNKGVVNAVSGAIPIIGEYDVVVLGGGTAGAPAGISAASNGAKTIVLEYLHGLGGTSTWGLIGCYWDGFREGYTSIIDEGVRNMAPLDHPRQIKDYKSKSNADWKSEWYRKNLINSGGSLWYGVIGSAAIVEQGKIKGIVVSTPYGRGAILCNILIDSTGSADMAVAAGADYEFGAKKSIALQGCGLPRKNPEDYYNNTDWTFINDTDVLDISRVFVQGKIKHQGSYDIGKLPQTRERRRIKGEYTVSVYDVINHKRYDDTISYHKSSFDTHGVTIDPLFTLIPPEKRHIIYEADVPLRALRPKGIDNIIVTGLGASADRDAMPVIRMQPCLQNQGYAVGYLVSCCIKENKSLNKIDIKKIQKHLVNMGNLPKRVLTDKETKPFNDKELKGALSTVNDNYKGLEILFTDKQKCDKLADKAYHSSDNENDKFIYASILAMLGNNRYGADLGKKLSQIKEWDKGWHYTGMGQFGECMSRTDALIMALGNSRNKDYINAINEKALILTPNSCFSHYRAIAEAMENINSPEFADVVYQILMRPGMTNHEIGCFKDAQRKCVPGGNDVSTRNRALKELVLARALYLCGDKNNLGKETLIRYANSLHGLYSAFAVSTLENKA
ncbi:MAG: FAD-dependent oxidoreductase [Bacteroidales bacterium]|nr:FAD-dependent oxidoreductase [Bacteroidales bacterium]